MNWSFHPALLADQERFRALGQNLRGRTQLTLTECLLGIACLAAIVLAVWIVAQLVSQSEKKRTIHHPRRLFRALCRQHQIGIRGRRALWQLAQSAQLPQHAMIFVRPDLLDNRLGSASSRRQQALYAQLRETLFGTAADSSGS
jgi:hypothetical protein